MSRTKSRENAFQLVYGLGFEEVENMSDIEDGFVSQLVKYVTHNTVEIDKIIAERAKDFAFDRIYKVDLALLRLGLGEMLYGETPKPVVIGAVVDLAKKYGTGKSPSFVNGILAQVKR